MTKGRIRGALSVAVAVAACGTGSASTPAGSARATDAEDAGHAPMQPRLATVGTNGKITYDPDGYPRTIQVGQLVCTLEWEGGSLVRAHATTPEGAGTHAAFEHVGGRVVDMTVEGDAPRTIHVDYDADGRLARWANAAGQAIVYRYDDTGRLASVERSPGSADEVRLDARGCPTWALENGIEFTYTYSDGRLSSYSNTGTTQYGVRYDAEGRIVELLGTGPAFAPLTYEPGEARGVDLFAGLFFGGFAYGFPAHSELFGLDGRCDATLRSRPTITSMLLRVLLQ